MDRTRSITIKVSKEDYDSLREQAKASRCSVPALVQRRALLAGASSGSVPLVVVAPRRSGRKRSEACAHRRGPEEYCRKCDA